MFSLEIDLGLKKLGIYSDRTKFKNINKIKAVKKTEKELKRLQRKVSNKYEKNKMMKGGSCQYIKTKNIEKLENDTINSQKTKKYEKYYPPQVTASIVKSKLYRIVMEEFEYFWNNENKHLSDTLRKQYFYEFRRRM